MRSSIARGVGTATCIAWATLVGCTSSSAPSGSTADFDADIDVTAFDSSPEDSTAPTEASPTLDSAIPPEASSVVDSSTLPDARPEAAAEAGLDATLDVASPDATPEASTPDGAFEASVADAAPDVVDAGPVCAVPPAGLVAWWPGNGNAIDVVGGDDGAFPGTYATGEQGQAFSIDANDWVTCPDEPALDGASLSVEVWLRHDQASSLDPVVKKVDASMTNGFALEFDSSGSNLLFWVYTSGGWQHGPSGAVSLGVWTHAVGTYDGTNITLYVDGASVGSASGSGGIVPSSNSLAIGRDPSNLTSRQYVGLIEQVSIYDRALGAGEVQGLYAAGSLGKCAVAGDGD